MAKRVVTHSFDKKTGKVSVHAEAKLTRHQKQSAAAGAIPWTKAPTTVAGKLKRAWIG